MSERAQMQERIRELEEELERVKAEMLNLAEDYRADWSCFDGRTLRHEIQDILEGGMWEGRQT